MSIAPLSLHDLAELLPRLQATVELLTGRHQQHGGNTSKAAVSGGKPAKKNGRGGARRGSGQAVREKLLVQLKGSKKGLSLSELKSKMKISPNIIGYNLRELRAGKKAKLVGSRRQAKWFAL